MTNLLAQTMASLEANAKYLNALLQQLAANNYQLNQQQQAIILQQMVMLSMNPPPVTMAHTFVLQATQIIAPPPIQGYNQQYQHQFQQPHQQQFHQQGGGHGGGSCGRHAQRNRGGQGHGQMAPIQYIGGNQMIPYISSGVQIQVSPKLQSQTLTKIGQIKTCASPAGASPAAYFGARESSAPIKKHGHQDGFTRSNYMEYEHANHQFCHKAMHKTLYPSR
jgi:hypothetical protein